ncbi:MAG: hypothetical protein ACOCNB_05560 [Acetivibrio ethanolgignens]
MHKRKIDKSDNLHKDVRDEKKTLQNGQQYATISLQTGNGSGKVSGTVSEK